MNKNLILKILEELSEERPLFHSEADFQYSLAWKIKQEISKCDIRLERPYLSKVGKVELDIFANADGCKVGLELKYVTREYEKQIGNESYALKTHSASPLRRYDFIKDVQRLENLLLNGDIDIGYAIFLTNDSSYRANARGQGAAFDISTEIRIGDHAWDEGTSISSTGKSRKNNIAIRKDYVLNWINYGEFKFDILVVEVVGPFFDSKSANKDQTDSTPKRSTSNNHVKKKLIPSLDWDSSFAEMRDSIPKLEDEPPNSASKSESDRSSK